MLRVIEGSHSAKEAMEAAENEMSLSRLTLSNEDEANGEYGDLFPFSSLPDELIGHTFSFLSIKDRLRARVNKRLNMIELHSKHHVDRLEIVAGDEYDDYIFEGQGFYLTEGRTWDCLRRITHNASIGHLQIALYASEDSHREVFKIIKDFDIGTLEICFGLEDFANEMMVDSFFLDLTRACKKLELYGCDNITSDALYEVHKMMMDSSTKLRKMRTFINDAKHITFLGLIGITYRDGRFFSERNIEAIQSVRHDGLTECLRTSVFDACLEISFILLKRMDHYGRIIYEFNFDFSFELHETEESLDQAKNRDGMVRVAEESPPVKEAMEEDEDEFPFSALPDELIGHTFSFLPIKDRLRARVNKRLDKVELQYKYHVDYLQITRDHYYANHSFRGQGFYVTEGNTSDCLRRITHNASIGFLEIDLNGSSAIHRDVCKLIKKFDIGTLCIKFGINHFAKEIMVDSIFLDLTRTCKKLNVYSVCESITPEALHEVYKMMMEKSTKLRKIQLFINHESHSPFLALIGITFRDGQFFSKRNIEAIEVDEYSDGHLETRLTSIFDGSLEISFMINTWTNQDGSSEYEFDFDFSFELHETEESLHEAKNKDGYAKVNIVPE